MKYLPPFEVVKQHLDISNVKGEVRVSASYEDFLKILKLMISGLEIDETWYREKYEDIDQAVRSGGIESPKRHFVDDGYFEGRLPYRIVIDSDWYLSEYPDVAESVHRGDFSSAEQHFWQEGYREGRLPFRL